MINSPMVIKQETGSKKDKIVIWGPPSSGKSTLAGILGHEYEITNIIHTDDYLSWDPVNKWVYKPKQEFMEIISPLLDRPRWIVEGNLGEYISREEMFNKADEVIILNPSYLKLIYRIITRGFARNTIFKFGKHTDDNAIIKGKFTIIDLFKEIIGSIQIISSFKKYYLHYLIQIGKNSPNPSKLKMFQ